MKRLSLVLLNVGFLTGAAFADRQTICIADSIPEGAVLVAYTSDIGCNFGFHSRGEKNAKIIETSLSVDMTVCDASPMPAGYAIKSQESWPECAEGPINHSNNAKRITKS